jgi:hypothetical protein
VGWVDFSKFLEKMGALVFERKRRYKNGEDTKTWCSNGLKASTGKALCLFPVITSVLGPN